MVNFLVGQNNCQELTLVIHTATGTPRASAIARCSLDMPISPALAPTIRMTHEGAPEVRPYNVVFRYRSCPAKSARDYMREIQFPIDYQRTDKGYNLSCLLGNFLPTQFLMSHNVSIGTYRLW